MRRFPLRGARDVSIRLNQKLENANELTTSRVSSSWPQGFDVCYPQIMPMESPYYEAVRSYRQHQQLRAFASSENPIAHPECWNCQQSNVTTAESMIICSDCGHLRDVNADANYFYLMGMDSTFNIQSQSLTRRYHYLQTLVHPDKFVNKSSREQTNAADWSSLINTAYRTLLTPLGRGQYILKMHGYSISEDNCSLNQEFLLEMMSRNEDVEEAQTRSELMALNQKLNNDIQVKISQLKEALNTSQFEIAQGYLIEMRYMFNIERIIKNKLQSI